MTGKRGKTGGGRRAIHQIDRSHLKINRAKDHHLIEPPVGRSPEFLEVVYAASMIRNLDEMQYESWLLGSLLEAQLLMPTDDSPTEHALVYRPPKDAPMVLRSQRPPSTKWSDAVYLDFVVLRLCFFELCLSLDRINTLFFPS